MGSHDENEGRQKCKMKVSNDIIYISDREEGEIVEANDLEDVSDISSEEEFLLRQRIKILENYNDVLERKEAKRRSVSNDDVTFSKTLNNSHQITCISQPTNEVNTVIAKGEVGLYKVAEGSSQYKEIISVSLSDISTSDEESKKIKTASLKPPSKNDNNKNFPKKKIPIKGIKTYHKRRSRRKVIYKTNSKGEKDKIIQKKHRKPRLVSDSSAESDRENREKRRKLREAVHISNRKNDNTSLKLRLHTMLNKHDYSQEQDKCDIVKDVVISTQGMEELNITPKCLETDKNPMMNKNLPSPNIPEFKENTSDDDVEALRQLALQTKSKQANSLLQDSLINKNKKISDDICDNASEEIDSDTAELRLIALKSAMLKKAMERKKKQKTIAKLNSTHASLITQKLSDLESDIAEEELQLSVVTKNTLNNITDVESVDMDIDDNPSNDEFCKTDNIDHNDNRKYENGDDSFKEKDVFDDISLGQNDHKLYQYNVYSDLENPYKPFNTNDIPTYPSMQSHHEDIDEDEDILRAKLLTSLSNNIKLANSKKNLPQNTLVPFSENTPSPQPNLVINLGESDSGTDCESTRNLTVMHKKLTDQAEFQRNLDLFLKGARQAAETKMPVKELVKSNSIYTQKFTPMAVKHLPRPDQQEYRRLVKRMAELEKVKQARYASLLKNSSGVNSLRVASKGNSLQEKFLNMPLESETIVKSVNKPTINNVLNIHLAQSREKLTQATENIMRIRHEITQEINNVNIAVKRLRLAKKELMLKQQSLTLAEKTLRSRQLVHRCLLKRSMKYDNNAAQMLYKRLAIKNSKDKILNLPIGTALAFQQAKKIQQVNVYKKDNLDVANRNVIEKNNIVTPETSLSKDIRKPQEPNQKCPEKTSVNKDCMLNSSSSDCNKSAIVGDCDYQSPLQYKNSNTGWKDMDPNAVLCPFVVAGECKDSDCVFLHPK